MHGEAQPESAPVRRLVAPGAIMLILLLTAAITAVLCSCSTQQKTRGITHVKVYFDRYSAEATECICKDPVTRETPERRNAEQAAVFALQGLVEGPTPEEYARGYRPCLPSAETIARYRESYTKMIQAFQKEGRIDDFAKKFLSPAGEFTPWEDRIKVRSVIIKEGTAYADFSKEFYSYGGGSCFTQAIETSIVNTLKQFPEVARVILLVEGRKAELEP